MNAYPTRTQALSSMRSLSFGMIKSLIDNDYEDDCYELAYNLEPSVWTTIQNSGIPTKTDVLKILLKNNNIYDALYDHNEEVKRQIEFNNMQIIMHIIEYINKMNEARQYIAQAEQLKMQYGL